MKLRSNHQRCSIKKAVFKSFAIFTVKDQCRSLFLIKETPTQVFSRECCKVFKNKYFEEHLQTAAENSIQAEFSKPSTCNFTKRKLRYRCFPWNIPEFQEHLCRTSAGAISEKISKQNIFKLSKPSCYCSDLA